MSNKNNRFNQQTNTGKDSYKEPVMTVSSDEAVVVGDSVAEAKEVVIESAAPMVHSPKQTGKVGHAFAGPTNIVDEPGYKENTSIQLKEIPPTNQVPKVNQPTPKMLSVQTDLLNLSQALTPNKPVEGRWQYSLLELIRSSIEKEQPEGFDRVWNAILMFFHRSKGTLFSELHILRMGDNWPGSENDFSLYRRMIHVITETADPETRYQAAKRINLALATTHLNEAGRNRLISYYE